MIWNAEIGLWRKQGPGHTSPVKNAPFVHEGRSASSKLLRMAQVSTLDQQTLESVLKALRHMQTRSKKPELRGCLCWYWEEEAPQDTNAAFFMGMDLILLSLHFPSIIEGTSRLLLDDILADLDFWFAGEIEKEHSYYPNKYLGDLVCAWLLREIRGSGRLERNRLLHFIERTAEYWLNSRWGWGEHMSDTYSHVMLNQLSALLLSQKTLPEPALGLCFKLAADLLDIDDTFEGGPRIPTLRSYDFNNIPVRHTFRSSVFALPPEEGSDIQAADPLINRKSVRMPGNYGLLWNALGWHDLFPRKAAPCSQGLFTVTCHGEAKATTWFQDGWRLGCLSRFPIMENIDHSTWGLSWQCFPACLWHPDGLWGFWRWESEEPGRSRAHPAFKREDAYLDNALSSPQEILPVGRLSSKRQGPHALMARLMPLAGAKWTSCADAFWLLGLESRPQIKIMSPQWRILEIPANGQSRPLPVQIHLLCLEDGPEPTLVSQPGHSWRWGVDWPSNDLARRTPLRHLWAMQLGDDTCSPPHWTPTQNGGRLLWTWADTTWNISLDWEKDGNFISDCIQTP